MKAHIVPSSAPDELAASIATTLRRFRTARGLSVASLARLSGVSRAMITKIEQRETQPTAVLLARLSGALDVTLSELIAQAERDDMDVVHSAQQPMWTDPETGYRRRSVSPVAGGLLELAEVELPAGTSVSYPATTYSFAEQQIWVLHGRLRFASDTYEYDLAPGDCLRRRHPAASTYANDGPGPCRYLIAMVTQRNS